MSRFGEANENCHKYASQKAGRKCDSIMRMKADFRQDIAQRNTEERTGGNPQRPANNGACGDRSFGQAKLKQDDTQWGDRREQ
jgi:hypothetical protein